MDDIRETFDTFRSYNMKLNPSKCAFGMTAGKFLGSWCLRKVSKSTQIKSRP